MTTNLPSGEEKCCKECYTNKDAFSPAGCIEKECSCHSSTPVPESAAPKGSEDWQNIFLKAGTQNGCGDLSIMIGTSSLTTSPPNPTSANCSLLRF